MSPIALRLARLGAGLMVATGLLLASAPPVASATAWWQPAGFAGKPVTRVNAGGGQLTATVDGQAMASTDGGASFVPIPSPPTPGASSAVTVGPDTWSISDDGRVYRTHTATSGTAVDAGSPALGAGAHLITAPLATPGVVVAVSAAGVVWRRSPAGDWSRSLLLLPQTLLTGTPEITAVAAFSDQPLSSAVYLGTRGYGVLLSSDGGDDWIRADPGLPPNVLSLAVDSAAKPPVVWAGTSQGLFVHRLQAFPSIPSYSGSDLGGKAALTLLVCLLVTVAAATVLRRAASS